MGRTDAEIAADPWNPASINALIDALQGLRHEMLALEEERAAELRAVDARHGPGARNLVHYLALRRQDLRGLQESLARLGVSSLGRAESHVLANLNKVLGILHRLAGRTWSSQSHEEPAGFGTGRAALERNAADLFGGEPSGREVRVMVTLPPAAARDAALVRAMVDAGMDVARINCAHDDAEAWAAMAANVRRAARELDRPCRILTDLGGPKLRTGPIAPGPAVIKWRPRRDELGRVLAPATIEIRASGAALSGSPADACIASDSAWLAALETGDRLCFDDARGAPRSLRVTRVLPRSVWCEARRTAYVTPGTRLRREGKAGVREGVVTDVPTRPRRILLRVGDRLLLTACGVGTPAEGRRPASIPCTLPEIFAQVKPGEPLWLDDGKIGARVRAVHADGIELEITTAREEGDRLGADKGINLPETALDLPALTAKDRSDLAAVADFTDMVGLSFVQRPRDVEALHAQLNELGAEKVGVVLKIETRRAFENLPELLLAAMRADSVGVMIARGDLAVECGYERLAEVQEEVLWLAEAAHLPVIWATQVLESLAKTGQPSRAEITDAAHGVRAECVMLNKGPHIVETIAVLDGILRRMEAHQDKKRPLLRELASWRGPEATEHAEALPGMR
jgi:pyruvate kinase